MWTITIVFILIAIIAAFSLVLVKLSNRQRKSERAALINHFGKLAVRHDLVITDREVLEDLAIGLDRERRKLLIVKREDRKYDSMVIDLREVTAVERKELREHMYPNKYALLTDALRLERILLELKFVDERTAVQILFYDFISDSFYDIAEMKEKAIHWEGLLSDIVTIPHRRRA